MVALNGAKAINLVSVLESIHSSCVSFKLGHYIYTEASGINKDQKARLQSRNFPPTNGRCLSFWYHMYGSGIGQLNVYIESTVGAAKRMWSLSGDQGDEWKMTQITLSSAASEYKVLVLHNNFSLDF